ncbi:hypothetical protein BE221DRAFT_71507 [Ostreococcus tauri]|uniref:Coenzyme Q-binding protein COQ10 START domain-containing protein n=1 Tax=Ostreococcus tauri TaxID=70448 RepID=A0A1Y5ICW7_OSTTA|nr:hypothetical protein BE221DRAFT_71507 [Ostreococcus tauri]
MQKISSQIMRARSALGGVASGVPGVDGFFPVPSSKREGDDAVDEDVRQSRAAAGQYRGSSRRALLIRFQRKALGLGLGLLRRSTPSIIPLGGSDATAAPSKHHRSPGFTGSHPAAEHISAPLSFTSPIHSLSLVQITSPGLHGTNLCAPSSEKKSFRHAPYKASHAEAQIGVPSAVPTLPSHTLHSTAAHASRHVSENPFNCMCTTFARTASVCARPQHVFARCASQNVIPFPLPGADPSRANASCARLLLHVSTVPAPRATPPPHSTSTSVTTIVRDIIPPIVALTRAPECALTWSENGAYAVRGTMTVRGVSATSVYNLLTDYEASPRAFRAVRSVRVIECEGDACVATNVYIEQECEWKFFVFGGAFPTAFEVEERDEELKMRCSLAPGRRGTGFLRDFEGAWAVEDGPEGVRIEHTLMVKPKFTPPYASKVFVQQVDQILQDLLVEIESWNGAPYDAPPHRRG